MAGGTGAAKHILIQSKQHGNRSHTELITIIPTNPITLGMLTLITLSPQSQWNAEEQITSKCDCYCAGLPGVPTRPSWPVSYSPSPPFSWCHCPGQRFPLLASHCILNINKERWNNVWRRCVNNVECVNDCFVWVNNKAWVFTNWCTKSHHDPGSAINPSPSHSLSHSWTWRLFLFTLSNLYGISTFHLDLV